MDYLLESFTKDGDGIAYIYCDPNDPSQQTPVKILADILAQLLDPRKTLPVSVLQLYERHDRGTYSPQVNDIETTLLLVCNRFQKLFFVVDGLEEWQAARHGNRLLELLKSLKATSARMFVTTTSSRSDIGSILRRPTRFTVTAHETDVERYLRLEFQKADNFIKLVCGPIESKIVSKISQSSQGTRVPHSIGSVSITDKAVQISGPSTTVTISHGPGIFSRCRTCAHAHASGHRQTVR